MPLLSSGAGAGLRECWGRHRPRGAMLETSGRGNLWREQQTIRHFLKLQHTSCFNENITRIISGAIMTISSLLSHWDSNNTQQATERQILSYLERQVFIFEPLLVNKTYLINNIS